MSNIKIPDRMLEAAISSVQDCEFDRYRVFLESALRWLSENPIVPTKEQTKTLWGNANGKNICYLSDLETLVIQNACKEWQSIMFVEPEPEIPEDIRPLLRMDIMGDWVKIHSTIIEAYRRGQRSKETK